MSKITLIKPQKNNKRVNVYLDGKFGFGVDLENFVKLNLKVDQEYSNEEIEGIIKKAELAKIAEKIINFATVRPRSEKEINDWLRRKKVHESLYSDLKKKLRKFDFLSDKKFASWWIEQRINFRPKPKVVLKQELRQKGIAKEIIEKVLGAYEIDEAGIAKRELEKRSYKWQRLEGQEKRRKMAEFLQRKGYNWEIIKDVLVGFDKQEVD